MKTHTYAGLVLLGMIMAGAAVLVLMKTAPGHSQAEWNALNAKVVRLERSTTVLQRELSEIQKPVPAFISMPSGNIPMPGAPDQTGLHNQLPPGSAPFVFNGMTYYITPLALDR